MMSTNFVNILVQMSIFSEFQKPSFGIVDSNMDWMLQLHSHNNILTGLDCTHVY
jgi:hypothetical protein